MLFLEILKRWLNSGDEPRAFVGKNGVVRPSRFAFTTMSESWTPKAAGEHGGEMDSPPRYRFLASPSRCVFLQNLQN